MRRSLFHLSALVIALLTALAFSVAPARPARPRPRPRSTASR